MINKSPAFQFYVNDWLSSPKIMTMTPAEEGAYIRLLAIAWGNKDCGLPDDDNQLAILSRLNEGWFKGSSDKIRKCFFKKGNRLYNKRLLFERKKQKIWRDKSSLGGLMSAKARAEKKKELNNGSRVVQPPYEPKGNSSSSSSSSSSYLYLKDKYKSKDFFEQLWKDYPRRLGKKEALRHFNASVESEKDRQDIRKALNNYLTTDNVVNGITKYIKNGSTWFNNWRDWVEYTGERTGNESCQEYKNEHPVILFPTITEEQRLENIKNIKAIINKIGNLPEEPVGTNLNRRKKCQ